VVVAAAGRQETAWGTRASPGDRLTVAGVEIEAVRPITSTSSARRGFPFTLGKRSTLVLSSTVGGVRLYFAGDTDQIPEMADIACDVALLPVSGTYVMTAEEAAAAARTLKPQIVVPMHYGFGIGTADDGATLPNSTAGK